MLWSKKVSTKNIGDKGEAFAKQYLTEQGLVFIAANVHCRQGEIDLIMKDQHTWVFIEVKYRHNTNFGSAIAAVSKTKQTKIKHCVAFYLHKMNLNEYNTPCRCDILGLEGDLKQPNITWLKNAF